MYGLCCSFSFEISFGFEAFYRSYVGLVMAIRFLQMVLVFDGTGFDMV